MAVMIASIGYILGTFPLAYVAQRFPTGKCCSAYIAIWGVVLILTPLCTSYEGLLAQRFVLGFFEAGELWSCTFNPELFADGHH